MRARGDTYVVDIETVGTPWKQVDEKTREYLLGRAMTDAEREAVPRRLGLWPGTGRVIVIGMQNISSGSGGGVLVEGEPADWTDGGPMGFQQFVGDERALLTEFWKLVSKAGRIVTFNGRQFDGPFLMIRSAILGIAPSQNLAGYRYSLEQHCDLAEVLNFHGAVRSNFSLDYWCRRFGITSPKEEGLDGSRVQEVYEQGGIDDIAAYCVRDVVATAGLYSALKDTLIPLFSRSRG
ncbi:MAG: ribonuclease H-like domain-containing protein [Planctomycetota bacterium]|jgi:DNA polymerase elongation subunit (family B)